MARIHVARNYTKKLLWPRDAPIVDTEDYKKAYLRRLGTPEADHYFFFNFFPDLVYCDYELLYFDLLNLRAKTIYKGRIPLDGDQRIRIVDTVAGLISENIRGKISVVLTPNSLGNKYYERLVDGLKRKGHSVVDHGEFW